MESILLNADDNIKIKNKRLLTINNNQIQIL